MSFSYMSASGEITSSLTSSASSTITKTSLHSVTKTIEKKTTMECNEGHVSLYKYITSAKESGLNQDSFRFAIRSTDYWCSESGKPPKCPYEYCNDKDCQTCKPGLFA